MGADALTSCVAFNFCICQRAWLIEIGRLTEYRLGHLVDEQVEALSFAQSVCLDPHLQFVGGLDSVSHSESVLKRHYRAQPRRCAHTRTDWPMSGVETQHVPPRRSRVRTVA